MLWGLGVILLILYLYTSDAKGNQENTVNILDNSILATSNPETIIAVWEKPKTTSYRGGNCIKTLRDAGINVPRTLDGTAGSIPTKSQEIAEGETKVAITYEGPVGHALLVKLIDGQLISIVEGNHAIGVGRIVPLSVLKGFTE